MTQRLGVILIAFVIFSGATSRSQVKVSGGDQQIRKIQLTRAVRIPVIKASGADNSGGARGQDSTSMAIWPGATDELAEGPCGFDVLDDGSLLITDPLSRRVSVYDAQGKFRRVWEVGFAPDSVTVTSDGLVLVREASTGQIHVFDREGKARSGGEAKTPVQAQARVLTGKSGTVSSMSRGGSAGGSIAVRFDEPGSELLSLESLGTDPDRGTFVALEAATHEKGDDAINVKKSVRRYGLDGRLISEISDIPLDYYVVPVDELRVHKGVVYQLMTTSTEVRINEWDTN
jgi:hypothetical protein